MFAVLATIFGVAASKITNDKEAFFAFKSKFNKAYVNEVEEEYRMEVFRQNLRRAAKLNREQELATFGVTKFMDLTPEEFESSYLTSMPFESDYESDVAAEPNYAVLAAVDWSAKGKTSAVQDQGACGSCWAFSTIAATESWSAIKNGNLIKLSEQQLVDCDLSDNGCSGGNLDNAFNYIKNKGVMTATEYPYVSGTTGTEGVCKYKADRASKFIANGYTHIKKGDEDALVKALVNGPVSVALDAGVLQTYTGGIIKSGANCSSISMNHGVTAVGTDYDKKSNTNYYIVRNSWGPNWGEKGHFRIEYGKHVCAMGQWAVQPKY